MVFERNCSDDLPSVFSRVGLLGDSRVGPRHYLAACSLPEGREVRKRILRLQERYRSTLSRIQMLPEASTMFSTK
jgi:hypothetical protein